MKKNVDIPHLIVSDNSGTTQAPNEDGGETGRRTVVTPSRPSLRPPISPYSKISTFQKQLGSQNFNPGPSIQRSMSQPSFTFSSLPPRSHSSALFTSSPSSVPFGRSPNSSGSSTLPLCDDDPSLPNSDHTLPPRKGHKLSNTDDISSRFPLPQSTFAVPGIRERQIFNDAMAQFSQVLNLDKSGALEGNENIVNDDMERNISVGSTNSGVKRRAGKETAPSSPRLTRSASVNNLDVFTASDSKLAELAVTSPKKARRTLANRESAARSQEKYVGELEGEIQVLRAENTAIRALYNQLRNDHIAMENEHRELAIRYEGLEKQVQLHQDLHGQSSARINDLTNELNQYRGEANRSNMQQSLNPNMFHQLNINQPQGNPDFDGQI